MGWRDRIISDPEVCHGRVIVKGTRIPVSVILDNLADGLSEEKIITNYPSLTAEDIQAAIQYAAELARENILTFPSKVS